MGNTTVTTFYNTFAFNPEVENSISKVTSSYVALTLDTTFPTRIKSIHTYADGLATLSESGQFLNPSQREKLVFCLKKLALIASPTWLESSSGYYPKLPSWVEPMSIIDEALYSFSQPITGRSLPDQPSQMANFYAVIGELETKFPNYGPLFNTVASNFFEVCGISTK